MFILFSWLVSPSTAPAQETIRLPLYEVERSKALSVPTQGRARVLVLNPNAVEVQQITDHEVIFSALRIDSSLVHLWDASGRQTFRIVVTELRSIVEETQEREVEALRRRLGLTDRSLKFKYRASHRNLERGEDVSLKTKEEYRVRTQEWNARMGVPGGLLVGDAYLEERRDRFLGKEVTQPRHLSLALEEFRAGPLGSMDLVAGDKDLYLSDFTIPGRRYRGFGIFPSRPDNIINPLYKVQRDEPGLTLFGGEEREGYGLDLQAGYQDRGPRSNLAGAMLELPLLPGFQVHTTGLHREGDDAEFKSDHVYEAGFDVQKDWFAMDVDAARNGPEGAYQTDFTLWPASELSVRNRLWRIGKNYRTVTGPVSRDGQTGWSNLIRWKPPVFEDTVALTSKWTMYRDRNNLNPANLKEINTAYAFGMDARLPDDWYFQTGIRYEDESGSSFPSLNRHFETSVNRYIALDWPWVSSVTPSFGYRHSNFDKSLDIPGYNAVLDLLRAGVRANLWKGIWTGISWSRGWLHEQQPDSLSADSFDTHPRELVMEAGMIHTLKRAPVNLNLTARYIDVSNTFNKTHQPFSDRDQLYGSAQVTWKLAQEREIYGAASASRQVPETQGGPNLVEFFTEIGVRLGWDTQWAPGQKGTLTGFVYKDLNTNARRDPDEPGVPGVKVHAGEVLARTNSKGAYTLRGVPEGRISVRVDWDQIPPGHFFTSANTMEQLVLPGGKTQIDFGISTEVEFQGVVYNDLDGDLRFREEIDRPVPGVRLSVDSGQSAASGSNGYYSIRRVSPGARVLSIEITTIPDGYRTLVPVRHSVETKEGDKVRLNVPLHAQRSISGSVFLDQDGDSFRDPEDTGVAGILLLLDGGEAVTSSDGSYRLTELPPGKQSVSVDTVTLPPGHRLTSPESIEIDVPPGPFSRTRVDFTLTTEESTPAAAEEAFLWEKESPPAAVPLAEETEVAMVPAISGEYHVVDAAWTERFPEAAAELQAEHPEILVDRSQTPEEAGELVIELISRGAQRVIYHGPPSRAAAFREVAAEALIEVEEAPEPFPTE